MNELLKQTSQILSTYATSLEDCSPESQLEGSCIARNCGSDNLFDILGIGQKETLHSRLLGYLLNSRANHGHADRFLDLFVKRLGIDGITTSLTRVELEKGIPVSNRRIDIYLTDGVSSIIIENKIWAADQKAQLRDYVRYGLTQVKRKNLFIIYLTPYKDSPAWHSLSDPAQRPDIIEADQLNSSLTLISYGEHIHPWILECMDHVDANTLLYQSLNHYQLTLKKLFSINTNPMEKQIEQLLLSPQNAKSAFLIHQCFARAQADHIKAFWKQLVSQINAELWQGGWMVEFNTGADYFSLHRTGYQMVGLPETGGEITQGVRLYFADLYEKQPSGIYYGIWCDGRRLSRQQMDLIQFSLQAKPGLCLENGRDGNYLTWQQVEDRFRFSKLEGWEKLITDPENTRQQLKEYICQIAETYKPFLDGVAGILNPKAQ